MCAFAEACISPIILVIVPLMACDLSLNTNQTIAVHATLTLGMAAGAFLFGILIDANGRKDMIPAAMVLIFFSSIALSFTQTIFLTNVSIFILGLGLAGNNVVLRVYLIEVSPMERRGFCLVILDLFGVIGYVSTLGLSWVLLPSIMRMHNEKFRPNSWRVLLGLGGVPNFIMACAASLLPASPRYLIYRRRHEEALMILQQMYAINNSKHADTYPFTNLDNCVRPDEDEEHEEKTVFKVIQNFCLKTYKRIREICQTPYKCTTMLGICINFLQFPGIIWVALWSTYLLQEMGSFNRSPKKSSSCMISVQNLALGFLQNCERLNIEHFRDLFYLSLSYVLAEIVLLLGIDVIGRKIFLVSSGLAGAVACFALFFTVHNVIQIGLYCVILIAYAIGRTASSILLLENYSTGVRGTIIGLSRIFPYLVGSFTKFFLNIYCTPSIFIMSGILMTAAIAVSQVPDLTRSPMQE
ncbi:synaptic vesicle 2-related protein [Xylocopa sonorina]|uniref:synaptic vesicle 2-related protein n=1 Tax=Xylocopa sonorina TaxID=1818115 RepID=UPI00403A8AC7